MASQPPPTLSLPTSSSSSSSLSSASPRATSMRRLGSNSSSLGSDGGHAYPLPLVAGPSRKPTLPAYPPDRFIIVRPPASKQNHPLNLQIQLVVPVVPPSLPSPVSAAAPPPAPAMPAQRRDPSFGSMASAFSSDPNLRRRSIAVDSHSSPNSPREGSLHAVAHATLFTSQSPSSGTEPTPASAGSNPGAPLRRTSSMRSTGSVATTMSGWSGVSDAASSLATRSDTSAAGVSAAASGRKVTPLYNLQWHTVLPTYICDAGTDAKIAKFAKRGIEVADLANIEPGEIRQGVDVFSAISRDSAKGLSLAPSRPAGDLATSFSSTSLNGGPSGTSAGTAEEKGPAAFFNKFKKLGVKAKFGSSGQQAPESGSARDATGTGGASNTDHHPDLPSTNAALSMVGPAAGSGRRAEGYVWQVRRWARPDLDALARAGGGTAVSLEWRKMKKQRPPPAGTRGASPPVATGGPVEGPRRAGDARPSMDAASRSGSAVGEAATTDPNQLVTRQTRQSFNSEASAVRPSPGSRASSPRMGSDEGEDGEEAEEEDSDPEDSERVWTCELVLHPTLSPGGAGAQSSSSTANNGFLGAATTTARSARRILVGTVRPNPHHPRVIAHFAVPGTLTTVTLGSRDAGPTAELKASEIKDLVAITCLWLCVKERLGGLGGEGRRRKGDGSWRLRM